MISFTTAIHAKKSIRLPLNDCKLQENLTKVLQFKELTEVKSVVGKQPFSLKALPWANYIIS